MRKILRALGLCTLTVAATSCTADTFQADIDKGTQYYKSEDYTNAEKCFQSAYAQASKRNDKQNSGIALFPLAAIKMLKKDRAGAETDYEKVLTLVSPDIAGGDAVLAKSKRNLATLYDQDGRYKEAETLLNQVLESMNKNGTEEKKAVDVLVELAYIKRKDGNPERALAYYKQALDRCDKISPRPEFTRQVILTNIVPFYLDAHEPQKALESAKAAVDSVKEQSNANPLYVEAYTNLATVLCAMKKTDDAVTAQKDALKGTRSPALQAEGLNNLGRIYTVKKDFSKAQETLAQAVKEGEKAGEAKDQFLADSSTNQGIMFAAKGDKPHADEAFKKAIELAKNTKDALTINHAEQAYKNYSNGKSDLN